MTTTHKPATPLPWHPIDIYGRGDYRCVRRGTVSSFAQDIDCGNETDAAYIAHACNKYPDLVAFVRVVATQDAVATKQFMKDNARELLRACGEAE